MARIDFRALKRMVGRDGVTNLPGSVVPEEEWATWHNPGAYVEQGFVEVLIDGETVAQHVQAVLQRAISSMPAPTRRLVPGPLPAAEKRQAGKKAG